MRRSWIGMIALTLVLQVPDVQAQQAVVTADGSPTVNAVWVEHELSFTFMGAVSMYQLWFSKTPPAVAQRERQGERHLAGL